MRNLLCAVIGLVLSILGWEEYELLQHSRAEPSRMELADLEAGQAPEASAWARRAGRKGQHEKGGSRSWCIRFQ